MQIALIGLAQAGKRTLFSMLTGRAVPDSREPGEVLEGIASICDRRVDALAEIFQPEKATYAENDFVLCPDASTGSGASLWMKAARRCQLMCLVVRSFESDQVYHPSGSVDAKRDRDLLETELVLADLELVETRLQRLAKEARSGLRAEQKQEQAALEKCLPHLEAGEPLIGLDLPEHELKEIQSLDLVTFMPQLCVYNVSEEDLASDFGPGSVAISCKIEGEVMAIDDAEERQEFLEALGLEWSGLDRVNTAAYDALGLMSFYTVGEDECRAWTVSRGSLAPTAGGKVHSDIERGFIRAEVIGYDDFIAAGSEQAAKAQGCMQTRGKDYVVSDGDILHFLFSV